MEVGGMENGIELKKILGFNRLVLRILGLKNLLSWITSQQVVMLFMCGKQEISVKRIMETAITLLVRGFKQIYQ